MERKSLFILILLGLILSGSISIHAKSEQETLLGYPSIKISIGDSCKHCAEGFNVEGTTYVPLRFIMEALGSTVEWNKEDRSVVIIDHEKRQEYNKESDSLSEKQEHQHKLREIHQLINEELSYFIIMDSQISIAMEMYREFGDTQWITQLKQGSLIERKNNIKHINERITNLQDELENNSEAGQLTILSKKLNDIITYHELSIVSLENYSKNNRSEDYKSYLLHRKFALDIIEDLKEMIMNKTFQ